MQEICYLPTWPFFTGEGEDIPGRLPPSVRQLDWSLRSNFEGVDDSVKPQPRCIPRIEFQTPISDYEV